MRTVTAQFEPTLYNTESTCGFAVKIHGKKFKCNVIFHVLDHKLYNSFRKSIIYGAFPLSALWAGKTTKENTITLSEL